MSLSEIDVFLKKKENKQIEGRSIYAILAGIVFILIALSFLLGMYQFHALVLANIILAYSYIIQLCYDYIIIV